MPMNGMRMKTHTLSMTCGLTTALACAAGSIAPVVHAQAGAERNAGERVGGDADLPITRITMYRSGVASYQRDGFVDGNATLRMLFAEDALDDVLKSLVILDSGGGRVGGVNYTVSEPVSRRLAALGLSQGDLSMDGLLKALKGVTIRYTPFGANTPPEEAIVLGLSSREVPSQTGGATMSFVTLMQQGTIRSLPINAIGDFEIADAEIAQEFRGVLAELNRQRGELQKAVEVSLVGNDRRRVGAMYVAPAPVWKTSYRLVLDDTADVETSAKATLVGWAIVENTSDQDWDDITLSLVSGRPVGFTMPLSDPVYTPRPSFPVPIELAIAGQVYDDGMQLASELESSKLLGRMSARGGRGDSFAGRAMEMADAASPAASAFGAGSMTNNAAAAASAGDAGEFFVYTVNTPVSVGRQSSAMIPLINEPINAARVSIYTSRGSGGSSDNPMRGVRFTNETDLELLAGPITVYDSSAGGAGGGASGGGTYQGDARIDRVGREDERLIAYAQDLDVKIDERSESPRRRIDVKIQDGVYTLRRWQWARTTYTIANKDERRPRTLIIEHPCRDGWELESDIEPRETTGSALRFDVAIKPATTHEFVVSHKRIESESLSLSGLNDATVRRYSADGSLPKDVRDVFVEYARRRAEIERAKDALGVLENEQQDIDANQARIRSNMNALDRQSDLYRRYVSTLSEQEDRLGELGVEIDAAREKVRDLEGKLASWLRNVDAD